MAALTRRETCGLLQENSGLSKLEFAVSQGDRCKCRAQFLCTARSLEATVGKIVLTCRKIRISGRVKRVGTRPTCHIGMSVLVESFGQVFVSVGGIGEAWETMVAAIIAIEQKTTPFWGKTVG